VVIQLPSRLARSVLSYSLVSKIKSYQAAYDYESTYYKQTGHLSLTPFRRKMPHSPLSGLHGCVLVPAVSGAYLVAQRRGAEDCHKRTVQFLLFLVPVIVKQNVSEKASMFFQVFFYASIPGARP